MAQLSLFHATSLCRPTASQAVQEATHHPPRLSYVPVYRVTLVRETAIPAPAAPLRTSAHAAALLRQYLGAVDREHVMVILMDRKNTPIGINTVSIGALHKQHDIKKLECELSSPGVLEFSCTHRLIPASDGLETSKEEGE